MPKASAQQMVCIINNMCFVKPEITPTFQFGA